MSDPQVRREYAAAVEAFRHQKDEAFANDAHSPLTEGQRPTFKGLDYFAPNFDYRVEASVEQLAAGDIITMPTTDGDAREFERYVRLHFTLAETACSLAGYHAIDEDSLAAENEHGHVHVFVPFRDGLTGKETYPAGRYLDVDVDIDEHGQPVALLDFNLAYNPYCAYNDLYSCPITPFENTLPIPVPAGERSAK